MVETMALGRMWRNMIAPFCMQRASGAHVLQVASAQDSARTTSTRLIQENSSMMPSSHQVGLHEAGENDQQVEHRQARPDLQQALSDQVHPAAIEALQRPAITRRSRS